MSTRLEKELEKLKKRLYSLSSLVEDSVYRAVKSIQERDPELARAVIQTDQEIDQMEVDIEEECLKLLALYQPVAIDLRFIIAVLKMNNDLERIADLAANIAARAKALSKSEPIEAPFDLETMTQRTKEMLRMSLDALVSMDTDLARKVRTLDHEVDEIHRDTYKSTKAEIVRNPQWVDPLVLLLSVSRSLERIADHATNLAEDVIYMIEGEIVRHSKEDDLVEH